MLVGACAFAGGFLETRCIAADDFEIVAAPLLEQFCSDCHAGELAEAHIDIESMRTSPDFARQFRTWRNVVRMLESGSMPPSDARQPVPRQRQQLISAVMTSLNRTAERYAGDPGPVVLRRLTSAEYAYTITDLTGLSLPVTRNFVSDAVGGEGFANIGDAQFMQDSTLERYLEAARTVSAHTVVGSGPLQFFKDPGKSGLELSAISQIQRIYREHGFRTAAGEGGEAFGLDRYPRAFFVAWRFQNRSARDEPDETLASLAAEEGIEPRFAEYIDSVLTSPQPSFPTSDVVARWQALPTPTDAAAYSELEAQVRLQCDRIYQVMHGWQQRFGQNADAKEEAPVLDAASFRAARRQSFEMNVNWPPGTSAAHIRLAAESADGNRHPRAVVIWREPSIQFRIPDRQRKPPEPLRHLVTVDDARRLAFGLHPDATAIGPNDFVTVGTDLPAFELPVPADATSARLTVDAELDLVHGEDCIVRCVISQDEDTDQGRQVSALLANPDAPAYEAWRAGVLDFARTLPQVSHGEPAPSDRDPIPPPFDNTYNNPHRNRFHYAIKYSRRDRFLVENILDEDTRLELDRAWTDLLGSFDYHDAYLRLIASQFEIDLNGHGIADSDPGWIERLAPEVRSFVVPLHASYHDVRRAFAAAEPDQLNDAIAFAERAWRRPLTSEEQQGLRAFYVDLRTQSQLDHPAAIRALITRILTAPDFLYRIERPTADASTADGSGRAEPLSGWERAARLSYFLWASQPDDELRRAAAAGELDDPEQLVRQTQRMLRDPKASRLAREFFGQWLGFYQFDQYSGIDPQRFPEFTPALKSAMHDEAVAFFTHVIRDDRPLSEILFADYTFLNDNLASHYGLEATGLTSQYQRVAGLEDRHRGGLFGLGAVLTVTSAPLRTSPVRRGDWILRRVLDTPVPPPPADAGSIPADDAINDGLSIRERLDVHRREASCWNCHARIDPLGFTLENYDAIGRWRDKYRQGQVIDASGELADGTVIRGPAGLRKYLHDNEDLFLRTFCTRLAGYALGRRTTISDEFLIEQMMTAARESGRLSDVVERLVTSRQFCYLRTDSLSRPEAREESP